MADEAVLKVFRGDPRGGEAKEYRVPIAPGMVVLDAIHHIQGYQAPDLACRWNCKAAKCGSCGAEVNGKPRLMCKTRMDEFIQGETITVYPLRSFPLIKDLVTDVSKNFEVNKTIPPFTPPPPTGARAPRPEAVGGGGVTPAPNTEWRMFQPDVDRVQEFRKCIECFLCQDVCHVIRNHNKLGEFAGPRFFVRMANLDMHPLDVLSRTKFLKDHAGLGYCNITKCCTEVCPEEIHITDNAIIPLKESVVSEFYSPLRRLIRLFTGK